MSPMYINIGIGVLQIIILGLLVPFIRGSIHLYAKVEVLEARLLMIQDDVKHLTNIIDSSP